MLLDLYYATSLVNKILVNCTFVTGYFPACMFILAELVQFPDYVVTEQTDDVPYEHKPATVSLLPK